MFFLSALKLPARIWFGKRGLTTKSGGPLWILLAGGIGLTSSWLALGTATPIRGYWAYCWFY